MTDLAWQIPLVALAGLAVVRIVLAPYWIAQEQEQKRKEEIEKLQESHRQIEADLRQKNTELENKLKQAREQKQTESQNIFHIEKTHWNLWWQAKGATGRKTVQQFTPEDSIPNDAGLVLEIHVTVTAIPPQLLQDLQLEIMGQRLPEEEWHSRTVDQGFFYLLFPLPPSLPLGTHQARLVAVLSQNDTETIEQKFSPFEVRIARTYAGLRR